MNLYPKNRKLTKFCAKRGKYFYSALLWWNFRLIREGFSSLSPLWMQQCLVNIRFFEYCFIYILITFIIYCIRNWTLNETRIYILIVKKLSWRKKKLSITKKKQCCHLRILKGSNTNFNKIYECTAEKFSQELF